MLDALFVPRSKPLYFNLVKMQQIYETLLAQFLYLDGKTEAQMIQFYNW